MVHESVGFLDKLRKWNLVFCDSLQTLPNNLRLISLEEFSLFGCPMLEKFPNIHQEMKRLKKLDLFGSGIRELPSSIGYLTRLTGLRLSGCHNPRVLPDGIYKLQMLEFLSNSFDGLSEDGFLSLWKQNLSRCGIKSEILMTPSYFPVLKVLNQSGNDIVRIPESLNRFTPIETLDLRNCKQLRQNLRLPRFINYVDARKYLSLDALSLTRLLNQSSISSSMALPLVDNDSDSDLNLRLKKRRKY
uniref:Disease resistance protein RPS4B/Roq1-like leucine-rich repeats domain-containing protein n=1 Tax=Quercus lobata TaxID=97700 RepID=A0A7N2M0P6_QUELO